MNNKTLEQYIIKEKDSVFEAYWKYKHNENKILLVVDDNNNFSGVITANEINKIKLNKNNYVTEIVNKNYSSIQYDKSKEVMNNELGKIFSRSKNINFVPVLKGNRIIDLFSRKYYENNKDNENNVIPNIKGNYSPFIEPIIKGIIDEYFLANYNINTDSFNELIGNDLFNLRKIYETELDGIPFYFEDSLTSQTVRIVADEINNTKEYNFKKLNFKEGDVVVDIGGNIGMVSIYLAKKFPFLKIYAYEPVKQNYESFLHNIKLNNIPDGTISVENKAVTSDGRSINMSLNRMNSGSAYVSQDTDTAKQGKNSGIKSTTIDKIFKKHNIKELKLLKIDCEGSEYEILQNADVNLLKQIKSLRGEFHQSGKPKDKFNIEKLYKYVSKYIKDIDVAKTIGDYWP